MEIDPRAVATAPVAPFAGIGWRQQSPRHDPLSGDGAQLAGGRFNPAGSFPVLYLCLSRACAVAELQRAAARQALDVVDLLPRHLYRYEIALDRVLDLTATPTQKAVGLAAEVLTGPEWTACQELGTTAHALGWQGLVAPSATGVGDVLAVFVQHIGIGIVNPNLAMEWHRADNLR